MRIGAPRRLLAGLSAVVVAIVAGIALFTGGPAAAQSRAAYSEPPTAPANLRVERDAEGFIEFFRWDASTGGEAPLTYLLFMESSPEFFPAGVFLRTQGLFAIGDGTPVCHGCEYAPDQWINVWVVAEDRNFQHSPPSETLTFTCCPF